MTKRSRWVEQEIADAAAAVGQLREQLCSALVLIRSHGIGENSATLDAALAGRDTGTAYAALRVAEDFVYEAIVDKHYYGYSTAEAEVVLATIRDARKEMLRGERAESAK